MENLCEKINNYDSACKCGCGYDKAPNHIKVMLACAEEHAGINFTINSWSRCPAHNADPEVGGSPTSSHLKGVAIDINTANIKERYAVLKGLFYAGFRRILIYGSLIHVDDDIDKTTEIAVLI